MSDYGKHYSVLKKEIIDFFIKADEESVSKNYSDLTFGAGGHTFSIAESIKDSHLYCFDQDQDAYKNGLANVLERGFDNRISLINRNFKDFDQSISRDVSFAGVLLDAGVSSHQFDTAERGFSFRFEADLDMRMNQSSTLTAKKILNEYSEEDLLRLLYEFGEEKLAKNIVRNIVEWRNEKTIETTKDLEDICFHSYPKKMRFGKTHPATKTFQALRIEVNDELGVLSEVIGQVIPYLEIGGVFAIISFHSLEDRIVKQAFKNLKNGDIPIEIVTKKPILPSEQEISENSRSRSAKLRVLKRVKEWPNKNKYPRK
jgi:16S rRNA (cytosine1402-N4)-methyltransferase